MKEFKKTSVSTPSRILESEVQDNEKNDFSQNSRDA